MHKLFGTDGVRGVANLDPMTSEMAMQLGRAAAHLFMRRSGRHQIVIGKDTRISGYMLESALTSGICSMGVDVLLVGVSQKAFLGQLVDRPVQERQWATAAAVAMAVDRGAGILRVHDVRGMKDVMQVTAAISRQTNESMKAHHA